MKAKVISSNSKRKTAMIVIHYDVNGCKRSETRHCNVAGDVMSGYVLGFDRAVLTTAQTESEYLAHTVDALNRELNTNAKTAQSYRANLVFGWKLGDNQEEYGKHIIAESGRALHINAHLLNEVERLMPLVEIRRAEKQTGKMKRAA